MRVDLHRKKKTLELRYTKVEQIRLHLSYYVVYEIRRVQAN